MSHAVESLVRHCFRGESGRQRDVALAIADGCPDHTGERMFKAIGTIAHLADVGHSTAERAIAHFVKVGWLIKVRGGGYGPRSTTEYKINPVWMELAGQEIAAAYAERRLSRRVPIDLREPAADAEPNKHPRLGCLDQELSTPVEAAKHPNFEAKHPKNEPKHPSSWGTNYEHRTNTLNNNPLPPKGGEPAVETKSGDALPTEEKASDADALLAKLIAIHPNHDPAHTPAARRALAKITDPAQRAQLAARLRVDATTITNWQTDGGRFAPKLSKWLAGTAELLELPGSERPANADGKDAIEARAVALGLGKFDDWMVQQSLAGKPPSWALYCRAANGGAA